MDGAAMTELIIDRVHPAGLGGVQKVYRFDNDYGASVVCTPFSYGGAEGLWELGVIVFGGVGEDDYKLTYDTPITDDVLGYLTEEEVREILERIARLPQAERRGDG